MAGFEQTFAVIFKEILTWGYRLGLILIGVIVSGIVLWFVLQRRRYNVPVEVKIPRSDGKIVDAEWAKGGYFSKKGQGDVFILKRKKMKPTNLPPIDPNFLQGYNKILTVVQRGINDYQPILPESFLEYNNAGVKHPVLDMKSKDYKLGVWGNYYERTRKSRFSLSDLWAKWGGLITVGVMILIIFVATAILWSQLGSIADRLGEVATKLKT